MSDIPDVWRTRVRFAETDAQNVVFYGEYVTYQDETFNQFLREVGYPWEAMKEWDVHVIHAEVDYRAPAGFGDELVCGMRASAIRESSIEFDWDCRQVDDGTVVAEGALTHVAVAGGASTRVPDDFREAVVAYQDDPPDPR